MCSLFKNMHTQHSHTPLRGFTHAIPSIWKALLHTLPALPQAPWEVSTGSLGRFWAPSIYALS